MRKLDSRLNGPAGLLRVRRRPTEPPNACLLLSVQRNQVNMKLRIVAVAALLALAAASDSKKQELQVKVTEGEEVL